MKTLGLLRHAKSEWDDVSLRDFDRGLNARGQRGATAMGAHIRSHGVAWDIVLASPAERVRRTLDIARLPAPIRWEKRLYLADRRTLTELLRALDDEATGALIAGHNPGLQELIGALVPPESENALFKRATEKFPTAAFAVIELAIERWADLAPGCGKLLHLARPRDLDAELGPEFGPERSG
jgi:phosphohistidine phosphatase